MFPFLVLVFGSTFLFQSCFADPVIKNMRKFNARRTQSFPKLNHNSSQKLLHFVRHAEGIHNVAGAIDHNNYILEEFEDACLTKLGINQCKRLSTERHELLDHSELLIVSPHRRTLQTATFSFPHLISDIPW
jgi:hypothetical protein